jgi:hypothetical protein
MLAAMDRLPSTVAIRNQIRRNDVLPPETWFEIGEANEGSPPVGQRPVDVIIRRRDVCGWAFVYRKKVDENSDHRQR